MKLENLIGINFGRLTVKEYYGSVGQRRIWICDCECGGSVNVSTDRLNSGHTKSCGCLSKEITSKIRRKQSGEWSFNALLSKYKYNAKKRDLSFELSKEYFKEITSSNCFYCGCEPASGNYNYDGRNGDYIFNGIDRVDNMLGYTEDNCVPCCHTCNIMKRSLTRDGFLKQIEKIYHNTRTLPCNKSNI